MKSATITEVKNQLSAIIDRVRAGETVIVTDRGQPVATIEPVRADADDEARLVRSSGAASFDRLRSRHPAPGTLPEVRASAVDALIEERRSGR